MTATTNRTMTNAQMRWSLSRGLAWFSKDATGNPQDDWRMPVWTADGAWLWDAANQCYEFLF